MAEELKTDQPEIPNKPKVPKAPSNRKGLGVFKEILIFAVILAIGVLVAWGINKLSKDDEKVQVAELPNYATPQTNTPENQSQVEGSDSNTTDNQTSVPAYQTPPPAGGYSTPAVYATPISEQPKLYSSATLGFSFTLPIGWTDDATQTTSREVIFYDQLHSSVVSSVEAFTNTGETLDSLMEQLRRSPSVSSVKKITVNGTDWLEFTSTSGSFNHGAVTIHNGRIYYINGELSKSPFVTAFKFM